MTRRCTNDKGETPVRTHRKSQFMSEHAMQCQVSCASIVCRPMVRLQRMSIAKDRWSSKPRFLTQRDIALDNSTHPLTATEIEGISAMNLCESVVDSSKDSFKTMPVFEQAKSPAGILSPLESWKANVLSQGSQCCECKARWWRPVQCSSEPLQSWYLALNLLRELLCAVLCWLYLHRRHRYNNFGKSAL